MILGAATTVGRIAFGKIIMLGYLDHLHLDQFTMVITGVLIIVLPLIRNFPGLVCFVLLLGLSDGCYSVLLPILTTTFCGQDRTLLGWGVLNLMCSVTFTLGPPVAGKLV